jgi:hypothetical protein
MLVVASAYSDHLDLCLYFYCLCFIIVLKRGNASQPIVVVVGGVTSSSQIYLKLSYIFVMISFITKEI